MKIEIKQIETERLILRKWTKKDVPFYLEYKMQEQGYAFSSISNTIPTLAEAKKSFKKHLTGKYPCWAIILKDENYPIGAVAIEDVFEIHDICELGWRVNSNYWGNGYATEAVKAVIDYIFKETTINRIEAINVHIENIASQKVCEKIGFKKEGISRQIRKTKTGYYDAINYSILRCEHNKTNILDETKN